MQHAVAILQLFRRHEFGRVARFTEEITEKLIFALAAAIRERRPELENRDVGLLVSPKLLVRLEQR